MAGQLTVTTPPLTTQLATLAAAKLDLGVTGSGQDAHINALIDRASAAISTRCGRVFGRRSLSEVFRRPNVGQPMLLSFPPFTITSVTEDSVVLVNGTDYEADSGMLWRLRSTARSWWFGQVTTILYTSGWLLPNDAGRDMPADIEAYALALVREAYFAIGRDSGVSSDQVEGVGRVQYFAPGSMVVDPAAVSGYVVRTW